jgi:hypothetical protein
LQNHFLIVNGLIVILVVISILMLRRRAKRDAEETGENTNRALGARNESSKAPIGWANYSPRRGGIAAPSGHEVARGLEAGSVVDDRSLISLNVLFQWNGHTFDAYEVLGLPAGSSVDSIDAAFNSIVARSDADTRPFLEAARHSILDSKKL